MEYQMRVLIIEDALVLRRLIETCFRDFDFEFEVQPVPHNPQRIGGFPEAELVVIGVYQPLTTGLAVIERLKQRSNPPAIVVITTDTREDSMALMTEAGADVVVKMPFRPDDLRNAATTSLENRASG
jgi:DNA-binding response OmpR family regulator